MMAQRRQANREKRILARKQKGAKSEEAEDSDEDGSDDERQAENDVAWERRRWDRSAKSIEKAFRLRERSGLFCKED